MTVDRGFPAPDIDGLGPIHARRVLMTVSCRDADSIPKVDGAGEIQLRGEQAVQVMHNGLLIEKDCYDGRWMTEIIRGLSGHHEPQEELVFHAVVERLAALNLDQPTMIEFGSYWSYYSLWFCQALVGARAIAIEPDPVHLDVGRRNAALNGLEERIEFLHGVVGVRPGVPMRFRTESTHEEIVAVQHDLASLMELYGLSGVDLVLADIQGAETVLLERASQLFRDRKIRFLIVSTHHQSISGDPLTHQRALDLLRDCGAHVIAEHTVRESFSGDGLIAATFDPDQHDLIVPISRARAQDSFFGQPEYEIDALEAEIARMHRTKLWRWSSRPRSVYARLRRFLRRRRRPAALRA